MTKLKRSEDWVDALSEEQLRSSGRQVVKISGKQIAVFATKSGLYACNNRCPHEGYPLVEGTVSGNCVITCNWHNWKFDLESGETLVGSDRLRRYPVKVKDGRVLIDVSTPEPKIVVQNAIEDLLTSFEDHDVGQINRELARISLVGGDMTDAVIATVNATHEKFEFGMTHAVAAGADWLALRDRFTDDKVRMLAANAEVIAHVSWDTRRMARVPYSQERQTYSDEHLVAAIEHEDETTAIALLNDAMDRGYGFERLFQPLARAALAHYQDFGHSLIYVVKAEEFVLRAGPEVLRPILLQLVRSLIYATREDLIPQFSAYTDARDGWSKSGALPNQDVLRHSGIPNVLEVISAGGADPVALYHQLVEAGCWQMLNMDLRYSQSTSGPVQDNVGWLDFTHTLTFANAVRRTCERVPDLWPSGLLQIGCFLGRNAKYVNPDEASAKWDVHDPAAFVEDTMNNMIDHGEAEYIVAAHLIKLPTAIDDEISNAPDAPWVPLAAAALNRFINSPLKRRHVLRTAAQSIDTVAREA